MGKLKNDLIKQVKEDRNEIDKEKQPKNSLILTQKLNKMFVMMRETNNLEEERVGLHASAVIAGDDSFCYREQVLSLLYKMDQGEELPINALKIFAAGTSIHEKWQNMFEKCSGRNGIKLIKNEARTFMEKWELSLTPDSIVEIDGEKYVVEYKSMNTFAFKHAINAKHPHPSGEKQCKFYMFMKGIPNGIVVMEDKNSQEILVHIVDYDYHEITPYISRLNEIQEQKKRLKMYKEAPRRMCRNRDTKRAQSCSMRSACFNCGQGRIKI